MLFSKWFQFSTIGELSLCGAFRAFYMYHGSSFMACVMAAGSFYQQEKFIEFGRATWSRPIGPWQIRGGSPLTLLCTCGPSPLPAPPSHLNLKKNSFSQYREWKVWVARVARDMRLFDILTILKWVHCSGPVDFGTFFKLNSTNLEMVDRLVSR